MATNIKAVKRTEFGSRNSRRFLREGKLPGVIYGAGENIPIILDYIEFRNYFQRAKEHNIFNIEIEGDKPREVLVSQLQFAPLKKNVVHIDFYEVQRGKILRTNIPLNIKGVPEGVKVGGILEHYLWNLHIECLPKDIPDGIDIDITNLKVGQSIHVRDLEKSDNFKILDKDDQIIVGVVASRKTKSAEEEAAEALEAEAAAKAETSAEGEA